MPSEAELGRLVLAIRARAGATTITFAESVARELGRPVRREHITRWETGQVPGGDALLAVLHLDPKIRRVLGTELRRWRLKRANPQ